MIELNRSRVEFDLDKMDDEQLEHHILRMRGIIEEYSQPLDLTPKLHPVLIETMKKLQSLYRNDAVYNLNLATQEQNRRKRGTE